MQTDLPQPPQHGALSDWTAVDEEAGTVYIDPAEQYTISIVEADPVEGLLVELWTLDDTERRLGRTAVDDPELAMEVAAGMADSADGLAAVSNDPPVAPTNHGAGATAPTGPDAPDEWDDEEEEDEWQDALDEAYEKADIPRGKGTLTEKTIDGRQYYYLQWREGDTVTSQYVAPVTPSSSR